MATRRTRSQRIGTALLATSWLVTAVLAAIHGGIDRHTYCPEHQAFEEQATRAAGPAAPSSEKATVEASPLAQHDVCPFGDCIHARSPAPPAPLRPVAIVPAVRVPAPPATTSPAAPVPLLANAPKASPPRVELTSSRSERNDSGRFHVDCIRNSVAGRGAGVRGPA